jgi:nitrite reductase (NADH) large subunit
MEEVIPESGVAALLGTRQIAVFRVGDAVYAIGNHDPASGANVLARGIVGDLKGELVVASPIYKHHYSLATGRCLEDPGVSVPTYDARIGDGEIWVRQPLTAARGSARRHLVVVGNGMAAMRAVEELLDLAPHAYDITVFGAEPGTGYNRILLSALLSGEKSHAEIVTHPAGWYRERGITLHTADPVVHIDRANRRVTSRSGIEVPYDRLLLATGSLPVVLPIPGRELRGVMTFRDLQDVDGMLEAARAGASAVVIGGGLLGLEAANGLKARGMDVTVVHLMHHLMERQLDAQAAALLQAQLAARGLKFVLPAQTMAILGEEHVSGVRLHDGRELAADLVVMAVGIRPNVELARAAGLRCERGILVDDTLQTFDPAIYAVGECVQHRHTLFGLVAPLWQQARVCAAHIAELGVRRYAGSRDSTRLKVGGIDVFSAGDYTERQGSESLVIRDVKRGIYKRLVLENDRLRGAVLYGDTSDGSWYARLIEEGRDIRSVRDELLFGEPSSTEALCA